MNKEKKQKLMLIVTLFSLLIIAISATYAYFIARAQSSNESDIQAETKTTDSLTFEAEEGIDIYATAQNFGPDDNNLFQETSITAKLIANNNTNVAAYTYNLYLQIGSNNFEYTTKTEEAELILQLFDNDGIEYEEDIDGLTRTTSGGVTGYDITTKTGLIQLLDKHLIEATTETGPEVTQKWTAKVTLINLNEDQRKNEGKTLNAKLTTQTEKLNVFNNDKRNTTYLSNEYKDKIKNVYFVDYIDNDLENKVAYWDFSTDEDESIIAWIENRIDEDQDVPYDLYIGSNSKIIVTSFFNTFNNMSKVEMIDLGNNLDTYLLFTTSNMFDRDSSLKEIKGIENLDVSSVTDMSSMFSSTSLTDLNLSNWDTSNVKNMSGMFKYTYNLINLKMNNAKFNQLESYNLMFSNTNPSLKVTVNETAKAWLIENNVLDASQILDA